MSFEVTTAFVKEYSAAFMHLFQQTESMLESTVRVETQNSEEKFWDFIGKTDAVDGFVRGSKTPRMNTPHSRRRCTLIVSRWADTTSDIDKIQMLKDPTSKYLESAVYALHRKKDQRVLDALGGIAFTGKAGTVQIPAAQECRLMNGDGTLAAEGAGFSNTTETALTIAKIATIGELMDDASVPQEGRYIVANPYNKWQLLQDAKIGSDEYNKIKALYAGEIPDFMGFQFRFLPTDQFTKNATDAGCIEAYAYQRDAILLSVGKDITTRVSELPDENYDIQAFAEMFIGAVRLQGPGVVPMLLKYQA